jgi:hypothetical protein
MDADAGAAVVASPADGVPGPDDEVAGAHAASAARVSESGSSGTARAGGHGWRARALWHGDAMDELL